MYAEFRRESPAFQRTPDRVAVKLPASSPPLLFQPELAVKLVPSILLILSLTSVVAQAADAPAAAKPNVIYFIIDELGYYEPAFMGNPNIQTPHVDKMAA